MDGLDAERVIDQGLDISAYLRSLGEETRQQILATWLDRTYTDPLLAAVVLIWISECKLEVPTKFLQTVVFNAVEELVVKKEFRVALRKRIDTRKNGLVNFNSVDAGTSGPISIPDELGLAIEQDAEDDDRKIREIAEMRRNESERRIRHLDVISKLPFFNRIERIRLDKTITLEDWCNEWADCSDSDLAELDREMIHQLID